MSASSSMTSTEIWPSRIRVQLYWANGQSEGLGTLAADCKRPAQAMNRPSGSTKGLPRASRADPKGQLGGAFSLPFERSERSKRSKQPEPSERSEKCLSSRGDEVTGRIGRTLQLVA
jgi:hypothetical protein